MINKPKCSIEKCSNDALLIVASNTICGPCYISYYKQTQKLKWGEIQDAAKKNTWN